MAVWQVMSLALFLTDLMQGSSVANLIYAPNYTIVVLVSSLTTMVKVKYFNCVGLIVCDVIGYGKIFIQYI